MRGRIRESLLCSLRSLRRWGARRVAFGARLPKRTGGLAGLVTSEHKSRGPAAHIGWCKRLIAQNEHNIASLLCGETHVGINVEALKAQNETLRALIQILEKSRR